MACQPAWIEVYDEDLRWHLVYQYYALELTYCKISSNLNVDPSTVQKVVLCYEQSGTVTSPFSGRKCKVGGHYGQEPITREGASPTKLLVR